MYNKKGRPCGVLVINHSSVMLPIIELNRSEVHFLLDILELRITEVIKDEMVSQRTQNKVGVCIVLFLDRHLNILSDPALDLA